MGFLQETIPLRGSILQAGTCQISSLAEGPRWSQVWQYTCPLPQTKTKTIKMGWDRDRLTQNNYKTPSRHFLDTFQTPSRYLPDIFQTPSRHLPDTLWTPSRHPQDTPTVIQWILSNFDLAVGGWVVGGW